MTRRGGALLAGLGLGRKSGAGRIGLGILSSRILGFVRERAVAHYFGLGPFADVVATALRGPNVLQNLLGEQSLAASFIPIYSRLLGEARTEAAGRFAGAILGLLLAVAAGLTLVGMALARPAVAVLAPGYLGDAALVEEGALELDRFELAVTAIRWIFPMTGLLVLSAWALGVLTSHGRFFLPYFAPVLWNSAIIAALVGAASLWGVGPGTAMGETGVGSRLVLALCAGALVGGALQLIVQLPLVASEMRGFRLRLSLRVEGVREALRRFWPVLASRGVIQLSGYLDLLLASLLVAGAVSALGWAQRLYFLPIALFAMAVAAAELPGLARARGAGASEGQIAERMSAALGRLLRISVPIALGYLALGFPAVGAIYRTGSFSVADNWFVYLVLAGYAVGLVAASASRLLANTFFALGNTRSPARIAVSRVALATLIAVPLMFYLDRLSLEAVVGELPGAGAIRLGALGLAAAASVGAWYELWRLRRGLRRILPEPVPFWRPVLGSARVALLALAPSAFLWWLLPPLHPALEAGLVWSVYGIAVAVLAGRGANP